MGCGVVGLIDCLYFLGSYYGHLGRVRIPGVHGGPEDLHLAVQGQGPARHRLHRRPDLLPPGWASWEKTNISTLFFFVSV